MSKYEQLDALILASIGDDPKRFIEIECGAVRAESQRIALEEATPRTRGSVVAWRIVDRRLQALRVGGKIKATPKGWVRVSMAEVSDGDMRKLQHMLGAVPGHYPKAKWGWRNYYATSGGEATEAMKRMEALGLVRLGYTSEGGMAYYSATEAGCRAAGLTTAKQIKRALED
ncbi:hypothetical protein [Burkholderia sp. Ac-20349]|uniref:hypothetical protein n=1 Tax=Burkholderia sp. Ac-20349 TaxID=2703893 RepID=UPI00197C5595|nr:hypothetical protein [Burkholderia sp. Ac-20349]